MGGSVASAGVRLRKRRRRSAPARPEAMESHTVELQHRDSRQVEASMLQMLAGRLTPLPGASGQQASYRLAVSEGTPVELLFERPTNRVTVRGVGRLMDSCIRLVRALDGAGQTGEAGMQLVSVKAAPAGRPGTHHRRGHGGRPGRATAGRACSAARRSAAAASRPSRSRRCSRQPAAQRPDRRPPRAIWSGRCGSRCSKVWT